MSPTAIIAGAVLVAPVLARLAGDPGTDRPQRALASRAAPWVVALLSAAAVLVAWGGLDRPPTIHDERAYLLQAELFASGRWSGPGRVLPEFFEQPHVMVTPVLAAKYFPGHALALVPGVLVGSSALVVVLLAALTGALTFVLARRVAGPWVALLTVAIWLASHEGSGWRASYFSETSSGALYLATWWALLRWREGPRARWLALAALLAGLCVVTRPLTGVALALPAGAWALLRTARLRPARWGDVGVGAAALAAALALVPLWSARTTGSWRLTPQTQYTLDYMPYDVPGLGVNDGEPRRPVPPDVATLNWNYQSLHRGHVADSLPGFLVARTRAIAHAAWDAGTPVLAAAALVGLAALPAAGWLAAGTVALHVLLYLFYAHPTTWTLYYVETFPVLAFVAALGLWRAYGWLVALRARGDAGERLARQAAAAALASLAFAWAGARAVARVREDRAETYRMYEEVDRAIAALPGQRIVVFVRYRALTQTNVAFGYNAPLQDTARVWRVYDRGEDNARLLRLAPDRVPYLLDGADHRIHSLADAPPGIPQPHGYVASAPLSGAARIAQKTSAGAAVPPRP